MKCSVQEIADRFLNALCHPVTCVVSLDAKGRIADLRLFDTHWRKDALVCAADSYEIWMISLHPDGGSIPYADDLENCIRAGQVTGQVRLFLCSEYGACMEVDMQALISDS